MAESEAAHGGAGLRRTVGLFAGLLLYGGMLLAPTPEVLSDAGWRTAAVAVLMAVWWTSEAIPIEATSMLPLVLFPVLGVLDMRAAAAPYAHELVFLFLGGFLIAVTLERWGLHKRIALAVMAAFGSGPRRLVLGFMVATALLSMWISNTATAAMMLPIGIAVAERLRPPDVESGEYRFGVALMLGIAYSASIGGVATLIGTPPNAVFAGAASELLGVQIGFLDWMKVGLPLSVVMLPVAWALLVYVLYPPGAVAGDADSVLISARARLGRPSRGEWTVGVVFIATALAWFLRSPKEFGSFTLPGIQSVAPWVGDATIAVAAAVALFALPVNLRRGEFALDWPTARRIPWGVLLLFGGGLSLARGMEVSGLAEWIGAMVSTLNWLPMLAVIATVVALFVFLTEVTSNTATSTMAMPVMAAAAVGLGMEPMVLMASAALAASMAFMLPVATPPNAIVFGSGYLSIPTMVRSGFWMNLLAIGFVSLAGGWLVPRLLVAP
ncbi:MAG: DASS family sodium-coupled anion symporter [Deltaproteobacteria bacterium]|nr:DASS family sodium-coupled anion symporter [Deltaproteobacteria bacterium]